MITVISFDKDGNRVDEAEADDCEAALLAARTLVADYFDSRQSTIGTRMIVRFLVDGRVCHSFTDRELRFA